MNLTTIAVIGLAAYVVLSTFWPSISSLVSRIKLPTSPAAPVPTTSEEDAEIAVLRHYIALRKVLANDPIALNRLNSLLPCIGQACGGQHE